METFLPPCWEGVNTSWIITAATLLLSSRLF